jgi:hypothetical protein
MTQEVGNNILDKYETLYNWCFVNNIRPFEIEDEDDFMLKEISLTEFKEFFVKKKFHENMLPEKPEKYLELRMYGLVPYNLSPIQQGIQFNHANDNYRLEYGQDSNYLNFLREWKTNILLNGGTSNEGHLVKQGFKEKMYVGTMQQHIEDLKLNKIKFATFYEPDLNSMLTAIVFLVDERVFNKKLYPDYEPLPFEGETDLELTIHLENENIRRSQWVESIGGPKNEFLREFLRNKRLA